MRHFTTYLLICFNFLIANAYGAQSKGIPYDNFFRVYEDIEDMIFLDGDKDGKSWNLIGEALSCHSICKADDWAITPGFLLEAGCSYQFCMMSMINYKDKPGKIAVWIGKSPNADSMTHLIIEPSDVINVGYRPFENTCFPIDETGIYYFGINNISEADCSIEITKLHIDRAILPESPRGIRLPDILPDPVGHKEAVISFLAPNKYNNGKNIPEDVMIDYTIDGSYVGSSKPSEVFEVVVKVDNSEEHEFRIIPYIDFNPGQIYKQTEYVGVDYPERPKNFSVKIVPGGLLFNWDPVGSVGPYGHPVIPEDVTYTILGSSYKDPLHLFAFCNVEDENTHETTIFFPISNNTFDDIAWIWDETVFLFVIAQNEKGNSISSYVPVDMSEISSLKLPMQEICEDVYDIFGSRQEKLKPGLNIIRKDGKTIKSWMR